jgi:rubrerythrin
MENEVWLIDMHTLWQCETCFHHYPNGCDTYCDHGESYRPAADKLTVIDPKSLRPKGQWVYDNGNLEWVCSECLRVAHVSRGAISGYILSDFCPNCGADMR